jgi:tRNA (adenine37-N6)-methyltransferase
MAREARLKRIKAIGFVEAKPWKKPRSGMSQVAAIRVENALAPGLTGLDQSSHAMIVFQMPGTVFRFRKDLVYRPHSDRRRKPVGIFAQRCPHRPNMLGVTTVRIVGVEGDRIFVRGLDAWNGTPVLDIKPFTPRFDLPKGRSKVAAWLA